MNKFVRKDKRELNKCRPIELNIGYLKYAEGSCLAKAGDTQVLCAISVQNKVPPFLQNTNTGWITAEYSLLPRSTRERTAREIKIGRPDGRTQEISRFIGRSIRPVVDLSALGERTLIIDCDVIQADGGTRTLCVNAGFVALVQALKKLYKQGVISRYPIKEFIGAISVGIVNKNVIVDLDYKEDVSAEVDMNVVITEKGKLIEIDLTAEKEPCDIEEFNRMLCLARESIKEIIEKEKEALAKKGI